MPVVRVMAEYESFPLWRRDANGTVNVDPTDLPISDGLARQLLDWATEYDGTLDRNDPLSSGFADARAEEEFYARGEQLAGRLAAELPGDDGVEYFDGRDDRIRAVR